METFFLTHLFIYLFNQDVYTERLLCVRLYARFFIFIAISFKLYLKKSDQAYECNINNDIIS